MNNIVIIPDYIRKVELSTKQRPKYWEWNGEQFVSKGKKLGASFAVDKQLFINEYGKVSLENLKEPYAAAYIIGNKAYEDYTDYIMNGGTYDERSFIQYSKIMLVDKTTQSLVVANPTQAGTPRYKIINANDIIYGGAKEHVRAKIFAAIREQFLPYFKQLVLEDKPPYQVTLTIYDTVKSEFDNTKGDVPGKAWDVGNRGAPYMKVGIDLLKELGYIENDDRLNITRECVDYYPTDQEETRSLMFYIETDEREIFSKHKFYQWKKKINH